MGGAKQDEAPVGHAAASPRCHKENVSRDHHRQIHLAVALKATARQLDGPCDSLAIPPKNEKMRTKIYGCHHFEMPIVMQHTKCNVPILGVTFSLFDIYLAFRNVNQM